MANNFLSIIQKVIADRGKGAASNLAVFNSLLADYAQGKFVRERQHFIRELKTKSFDEAIKMYEPAKPVPAAPPPAPPSQPAPKSQPAPAPLQAGRTNAQKAEDLLDRGYELYKKEKYSEALKCFNQAINLDTSNAIAYYWRGSTYDEMKSFKNALEDLDKSISLDPTFAGAYFHRGMIQHYNTNNISCAIDDAKKAVRLEPNDEDYKKFLNELLNKNEDDDDDDFEEDDDEEDFYDDYTEDSRSLSSQNMRRDENSFAIKCPRCGNTEGISDKRDIKSRELGFICGKCRESFTISFFGTCQSCRQKVGFHAGDSTENLLALGFGFVHAISKAMEPPKGFLASLTDTFGNAPNTTAAGDCTFCKLYHFECPKCRSAAIVPRNIDINKDTVKCPNCRQKMKHFAC